jgi:iron complex outermembrane receptor protein
MPIKRSTSEPGAQNSEQWRALGGYEFNLQFNEILSLRQNLNASHTSPDWKDSLYPASLAADERTLYRYPYSSPGEIDRPGVDTSLNAGFATGPVQHHFIGGVDYYHNSIIYKTKQIDYLSPPFRLSSGEVTQTCTLGV